MTERVQRQLSAILATDIAEGSAKRLQAFCPYVFAGGGVYECDATRSATSRTLPSKNARQDRAECRARSSRVLDWVVHDRKIRIMFSL